MQESKAIARLENSVAFMWHAASGTGFFFFFFYVPGSVEYSYNKVFLFFPNLQCAKGNKSLVKKCEEMSQKAGVRVTWYLLLLLEKMI